MQAGKPLKVSGMREAFRPRLKLFLSLDIVGSTAYKQPLDLSKTPAREAINWAYTIQSFYRAVEKGVENTWQRLEEMSRELGRVVGPRPRLWKTIGDEVVYWKEMENDCDIWFAVAVWAKVIEIAREDLSNSGSGLDVKPTLWIAGFPIRNRVVATQLGEGNPLDAIDQFYTRDDCANTVDFIGPGIDVGFRLCGLSSPKKMSISVDCAYLMAISIDKIIEFEKALHAKFKSRAKHFFSKGVGRDIEGIIATNIDDRGLQYDSSWFLHRFAIHFSGRKELKGVLGGTHYPHFWINTVPNNSLASAQDGLYAANRMPVGWGKLKTFCEKFYSDRARYIGPPFINRPHSLTLENLNAKYRKTHKEFIKIMLKDATTETDAMALLGPEMPDKTRAG